MAKIAQKNKTLLFRSFPNFLLLKILKNAPRDIMNTIRYQNLLPILNLVCQILRWQQMSEKCKLATHPGFLIVHIHFAVLLLRSTHSN